MLRRSGLAIDGERVHVPHGRHLLRHCHGLLQRRHGRLRLRALSARRWGNDRRHLLSGRLDDATLARNMLRVSGRRLRVRRGPSHLRWRWLSGDDVQRQKLPTEIVDVLWRAHDGCELLHGRRAE